MSYTNGIGSQMFPGAAEAAATSGADKAAKAQQGPSLASSPNLASTVAGVDQADLSRTASVMAQALSVSDVRSEKVAGLQQAIDSGSYNIPASDVAGKLLSAMLQ